ncbi:TolC family outer membrane protein [Rhodoferax sp. GW822-FHT02A01]|uniref:TolC family outer membrane protein n=1 Tax=Rhodoferax sp. GW822-FHT02A01 TaxID=3141537 RepID=UPI00315D5051
MNTTLKRSFVAASVALAFTASAQTKAPLPEPLLQAIHKAVATNPDVQAKWNAFKAADSQRDVAKAGFFPTVDLSASAGSESRVTGGVDLGSYSVNSAQITLDQILFDGLYTVNEVKRLGAAKLTRYYELLDASENAALEAAKAYADVVRYRELVDLATQNYVEHKQSTMLVEERANSGVGRRVDVEQANGRLALAESNLLTELTNLHDVSARYLRVVGEQPPASLPSLPDPFKLVTLPASAQALMLEGMRNSPTLLAAIQNARASRIAVDSAKAAYMPRVDFQVYANQGNNSGGVIGDSRATGAAVALTYNLFRGGADKAKEKQAVYLAAQAVNLQEKACRDLRQTLSVAYSDTRSLNEQLIYIDQHRLSAEKTREAYRQQFDIGQRTLLDLLDTQNEFFEASRSYINSRHDQAIAQARTLAGIGQLVVTTGANRDDVPSPQDAGLDTADLSQTESLCPIEETVVDTLEKIKAEAVIPSRAKPAPAAVEMPTPAGADKCGRITLLPDEDGKVGRVFVKDGKGDEVKLETAYAASLDDCQKVTPGQSTDPRYKAMVKKLPEAARYYRINFVLGKDEMLPESATVFKFLLEDYRKTAAPEVTLIGHSDKVGDPATNLRLSQKRAKAVYDLLTKDGAVPKSDIEQAWRGDKEPLPGTEGAKSEPRNRRVEVKIQ